MKKINNICFDDSIVYNNQIYRNFKENIVDIEQLGKDIQIISEDICTRETTGKEVQQMSLCDLFKNMNLEDDILFQKCIIEFRNRITDYLKSIRKSSYKLNPSLIDQINCLKDDPNINFDKFKKYHLNPFTDGVFQQRIYIVDGYLYGSLHATNASSMAVALKHLFESLKKFINENIMLYLTYRDRDNEDPSISYFVIAEKIYVLFEKIIRHIDYIISETRYGDLEFVKCFILEIYWPIDDKDELIFNLRD